MTTADLPPAYGGPQPGPDPFQRNTGVDYDTPQQLPPQPQHAPPTQEPQAPTGPPVFGRRTESSRRVQFTLAVYQGETEQQHLLTARADVDTASVFGFGRGNQTLGVQIETIRKLLMRTLVDDDGISLHALVEQVAPRPGTDEDDDVVPVSELDTDAWSMSDLAYRTPDGEVFDQAIDAANHMRANGSSLRRFAAIMDDDSLWIEQSALEQILDYLMTQAAEGRPTQRSSASSRSRRRTGR